MKGGGTMIKLSRKTAETKIQLELELQGSGQTEIETGIGFLDHMLELWACHGFFDLNIKVEGDLEVDEHHTVEDIGIVLGQAIKKELGAKIGIKRYSSVIYPMDETLVLVALDLSNRSYYIDDLTFAREKVGDFPVELFSQFFQALTNQGCFTLHFKVLRNGNSHHLIEACFKAFGRAFDQALQLETRLEDQPLSTKGTL